MDLRDKFEVPDPTTVNTVKTITDDIYMWACDIENMLRIMEVQILGENANELKAEKGKSLEETLIHTSIIVNTVRARLHKFADRMGVEI